MKPVPIKGKKYKFYDNGIPSDSRTYIAEVISIVTPEEAKSTMFPLYCCEQSDWIPTTILYNKEDIVGNINLYTIWKRSSILNDWLYNSETDYFIECSITKYNERPMWFVRSKDGGWFSLDIQSCWQGGRLDVDNYLE